MLAAETFRMGGHATHDEREARDVIPEEVFRHWGARDPIGLYEEYLVQTGLVGRDALESMEGEILAEIDGAAAEALASRERHEPRPETAVRGVYAAD